MERPEICVSSQIRLKPLWLRSFVNFLCATGCIVSYTIFASLISYAHAQTTRLSGQDEDPHRVLSRVEVAQRDIGSTATWNLPPQPYMREIYWRDVFGGFKDDTPLFFRDSLIQIVARSYYLTRNNFDGTRSQAWAAGGWIAYRSGLIADFFGVHGAFYTSQKLYGPQDESGTLLLNSEQKPLNVLGQAYGFARISDQEVRGGRMLVNTPLLNPNDSRMVPITFEGVQLVSLPVKGRNYDYAIGYVWNIKEQNSSSFIPISEAFTGYDTFNRGASFGMIKFRPFPGLSTAFMDYYTEDYINSFFVQGEYTFQLSNDGPRWSIGANVIDQRSVGADLLSGNSFHTYQASAKIQMVYGGWVAFAAGSITDSSSKIYSPLGSEPNYTNMQQLSFNNAGEKAIGGSIAYSFDQAFGGVNLSGLSAGFWYAHGWDAVDPSTGVGIPHQDELDTWVQYRPTSGSLKGFGVKVQYSDVWQKGNVRETQPEFRFVVDYTWLLRNK